MPPRSKRDTISDVLDNASKALETTKDLMGLAPIPGLTNAVTVLTGILEQVKVRYPTQIFISVTG